ncbi:hypothetical protein BMETH_764_2 [methanotrophic bacterial endosymbiont of Bathymodiolus sp.]|nr:hypothetical protein BMETH_764_2 [methanotrophic bacterial endosymbiont of Bathymodiolus sp.]
MCRQLQRETPPRAWGRRSVASISCSPFGNTPTGVGKTLGYLKTPARLGKHPHGRGED